MTFVDGARDGGRAIEIGGAVQKMFNSRRKQGPRQISVWARVLVVQTERVVAEAMEDAPGAGVKQGKKLVIQGKEIVGYRSPGEVQDLAA